MIEPVDGSTDYRALPNRLGCFLVTTVSGTQYLFDRARFTVTRIPLPGAAASVNDGTRTLRTVDSCVVGDAGFWTMRSNDSDVDFYWQTTSPVVSIVDAAPDAAPQQISARPERP